MKKNINVSRRKSVKHRNSTRVVVVLAVILLICGLLAGMVASMAYKTYHGKEVELEISLEMSAERVKDMMIDRLGEDYGITLYRVWNFRSGDVDKAVGHYVVKPGDRVWSVANRLKAGAQTPVKVTFNNIRLMDDLARVVASKMNFSADDFIRACDKELSAIGYKREEYPAAFIPDTYEFYVTESAEKVVRTLVDYRDKFWNDERVAKAEKRGLTPIEVMTLASIVEEESAKSDERRIIAGLYLNRLKRGMKLQADPTVKFALGDFSIRRVLNKHLEVESPYNTYKYEGIPPGPIRIVEKATIDAVLDAPEVEYLYMCAREDFSGYHNFTADYNVHLANARRYQAKLDSQK